MKNIIIAVIFILTLIWLFFTGIYLGNNESIYNEPDYSKGIELDLKKDTIDADIDRLAKLLKVNYQIDVNEALVLSTNEKDVALEIVVIYTSKHNFKIRIKRRVDGEENQHDMVIGDKLYNFTLTKIMPSSAVLDDGVNKVILKMFKTTIISITDVPKEVSEPL